MKKRYNILAISLLIAIHAIANVFVLNKNMGIYQLQGKDWQNHLYNFHVLTNIFQTAGSRFSGLHFFSFIYQLFFPSPYYPPGYYYTALILKLLSGNVYPEVIFLTSTLYLIITIILIYKIAEYLKPHTGLISAFIFSSYHLIFSNSAYFNLNIAACTTVALSLYLLLKTKLFDDRIYSVLFGFSIGLGMLTYYSYAIFLFWPFIFVIIGFLKNFVNLENKTRKIKNFSISLIIGSLITLVYYANPLVFQQLFFRGLNNDTSFKLMSFTDRLCFYVKGLLISELGVALSLLSIICFGYFLWSKINHRRIIGGWMILTALLLALVPKFPPNLEYFMPILIGLAIITGIGISSIEPKRLRYCFIGLIAVFMFSQPHFFVRQKMVCFEADKYQNFNALIKRLGTDQRIIGYIADPGVKEDFLGLGTFLAAWSKNKAAYFDFNESPKAFITNLDKFTDIVYVSLSNREWPDQNIIANYYASTTNNSHCGIGTWNTLIDAKGERFLISNNKMRNLFDNRGAYEKVDSYIFFPQDNFTETNIRINVFHKNLNPNRKKLKITTTNSGEITYYQPDYPQMDIEKSSRGKFLRNNFKAPKKLYQDNSKFIYYYIVLTANLFRDVGEFKKAEKYYRAAIKFNQEHIDEELPRAYIELARSYNKYIKLHSLTIGSYAEKTFSVLLKAQKTVKHLHLNQLENQLSIEYLLLSRNCNKYIKDISKKDQKNIGEYSKKSLLALLRARLTGLDKTIFYNELHDLFGFWKNWKEGIMFYSYLKILYPHDIEIYLNLGMFYKSIQDYEHSKESFMAVLLIDPDCLEAKKGIANADFFISLDKTKPFTFKPQSYQ